MDVLLHSKLRSGKIRRFRDVPMDEALRRFEAHRKILGHPLVTYYRVTLEDRLRGGYVVRDTYNEGQE
jgi:hypothetical protein